MTLFQNSVLRNDLKNIDKTDFKTFLKEQDEWEEYFETYQKELLEIKAQIDTTDKQIDEMVYEFYGLSEDDVAVVEEDNER